MANTRREFLLASAAAGGALGLGLASRPLAAAGAAKPLKILFLGGTGFIGPHMVRRAVARGHGVSIFSRGRSKADLPPGVERLIGDRDGGLDALKGRSWDLAIDNSGYLPRLVRDSAELLKGSVGRYVFTSSVAAYDRAAGPGLDEASGPLAGIDDPASEEVSKYYGPLKVLCEAEVRRIYPANHVIIRPTFVVGPGDHTDRFTYWVVRIERGGEVLAPGNPNQPVQYIDVRDLAEFFVRLAESGDPGIYNAVGPRSRLSTAEWLYGIRAVTSAEVSFTWVGWPFLAARDVRPMSDLPVWYPYPKGGGGAAMFSNAKSVAAGLAYRPLAVTARDTLAWFKSLPEERRAGIRAGLAAEREAELLAAWRARKEL